MKASIVTLLIFLASISYSQSLLISSDSTRIIFPDQGVMTLSHSTVGNVKDFQISSHNLKILITEINFLLSLLKLEKTNVALHRENEEILKSSMAILEKKYDTEHERTLLHKNAFETLENVSAAYRSELEKCKSDMDAISNERKRSGKSSFVRGLVWGVITGGLFGIAVDAAMR